MNTINRSKTIKIILSMCVILTLFVTPVLAITKYYTNTPKYALTTIMYTDTIHNTYYVTRSTPVIKSTVLTPQEEPEDLVEIDFSRWESISAFEYDRDIVATVVFNEAGYGCSDRHMELVAAVVYNRLNSKNFPDTVYEIVVAPKQYHPAYADENSYYGRRARESDVWEKCQEIATKALLGKVKCPANVLYQANFKQGTGDYEIHDTSYSRTWFCYGNS